MSVEKQTTNDNKNSMNALLRFLIPSLIGCMMFLVPLSVDGNITIGMGILADAIKNSVDSYLVAAIAYLTLIDGVLALVTRLINPSLEKDILAHKLLRVFNVNWTWTIIRLVGGLFAFMAYQSMGIEWVFNKYTGEPF